MILDLVNLTINITITIFITVTKYTSKYINEGKIYWTHGLYFCFYFCGSAVRQKSIAEESCSPLVSLEAERDGKYPSKAHIGQACLVDFTKS